MADSPVKVTSTTEEYLEIIYRLEEKSGVATTSDLVKSLKVAPGTVTNTIARLEKESLLIHKPYRGVKLTEKGRRIALRTIRKHRLSERLLTDLLDVEWEKVHEAACKLEHSISDEIAKKIEKALGHPKTCPHGNPIPTECGGIIEEESRPLSDLKMGERGVIAKITDERMEILQYLSSLNVRPNKIVEIIEKAPLGGPITIRIEGKDRALSQEVASLIKIRAVKENQTSEEH
ncbi:MAG: DtxR family transcriptional regulator [Candidatus Bathyarchaeota archaeon B63]|nr:MAG: DtxR family transcriptional regulator [Candidatus Bathyarchaeota archaeon B63]